MTFSVSVDWRSALGPVRDQGARPTCLAHAVTAAHEHVRRSKTPLSPEYLHYFASNRTPGDHASFDDAAVVLEDVGQPLERCCTYNPMGPPSGWVPPNGVDLYRRLSEQKRPAADDIESLLIAGHVPILGISLPRPFLAPVAPWLVHHAGLVHGLHAVLGVAVGRGPTGRAFLVRNSWGGSWGDQGHAWLDDAFLAKHLNDLMVLASEVI